MGSLLLIGAAACAVAVGLATTATTGPYGYVVPALDDASVQQISYTPLCTQDEIPVCVHPAFSGDLGPASAVLGPVLDEVAGLPGAPTRAEQVDAADLPGARDPARGSGMSAYSVGISLDTTARGGPVLEYGFDDQYDFTQPATSGYLRGQAAQAVFGYVVDPNGDADPAQQAVEAGLSQAAGVSVTGADTSVAAAAQRFAALSSVQRHTWLVANLARLRAGQVTLEELP